MKKNRGLLVLVMLIGLLAGLAQWNRPRNADYVLVESEPTMNFRGVLNSSQAVYGTTPQRFPMNGSNFASSFQGLSPGGNLVVSLYRDGELVRREEAMGSRPIAILRHRSR